MEILIIIEDVDISFFSYFNCIQTDRQTDIKPLFHRLSNTASWYNVLVYTYICRYIQYTYSKKKKISSCIIIVLIKYLYRKETTQCGKRNVPQCFGRWYFRIYFFAALAFCIPAQIPKYSNFWGTLSWLFFSVTKTF